MQAVPRPLAVLSVALAASLTFLVAPGESEGTPRPADPRLALRAASSAVPTGKRTVIERRVIGHSRNGREIVAFRVGRPNARGTAVVMAMMHGDERRPRAIVRALRDGPPISGLDLWLIPTVNPDGSAMRRRGNVRGVDLNRNFPLSWVRTRKGTSTWSGPRAGSEPETRALMRFLRRTRPDRVVSFHQPLYGIDTSGTGNRRLARRLAHELRLPRKEFACGSGCHGTMSQWFNHRIDGAFVTVELGRNPSRSYLNRIAPNGLLRAIGGTR